MEKISLKRYACCEECRREDCRGYGSIVSEHKVKSLGSDPLSCHTCFHDFKSYVAKGHSEKFIIEVMSSNYPKRFAKVLEKETQDMGAK